MVQEICNAIADVLDSIYQAKFSTKTNSRNVLSRILRKCNTVSNLGEDISPPALLQRTSPIECLEQPLLDVDEEPLMIKLEQLTSNERAKMQYHEHHKTCRKGMTGNHQCRLAKKSGVCNGTHCVLLHPPPKNKLNDVNDGEQQCTTTKKFVVQAMPTVTTSPTYTLRNPLDQSQSDGLVAWELNRPIPNLKEIKGLQYLSSGVTFQKLSEVPTRESAGRQFMIHNFQSLLTSEPNTMGSPYNETVPFWHFLKTGDFEAVQSLYQRFLVALKTANQYVVEHNVPLEYCTGSHNNAALLGGKEQSKSAIFYIAPYMGKEKAYFRIFRLQQTFSMSPLSLPQRYLPTWKHGLL